MPHRAEGIWIFGCLGVWMWIAKFIRTLHALYKATNGNAWLNNSGWNFTASDPCNSTWYGVSCKESNITKLNLIDKNFQGTLPAELGNLTKLKILKLSSNTISGTIPSTLVQLSNLQVLILSSNMITGTIPSELQQLANLQILILSSNMISGTIPSELQQLANLQILGLSSNMISGTIPSELQNITNLQSIQLGNNHLSGSLPVEMVHLNYLLELSLQYNKFSGTIPPEFGNFASLQWLQLSGNIITGTIPAELGNIVNLIRFALSGTRVSGTIPPELGNLTYLTELILDGNRLNGTVPEQLANLANLTYMFIDSNELTGTLPGNFLDIEALVVANVSNNRLVGTLPETFSLSLQFLDVSSNMLTGTIPLTIGSLPSLNYLFLHSNRLEGEIPSSLIQESASTIIGVYLQNNYLRGNLSFLASRTFPSLRNIDLSNNFLTGSIPGKIFANPRILSLALVKNCFNSSLNDAVCNATSLEVLALDGLASASPCHKHITSQSYLLPSFYRESSVPDCIWTDLPNLTTLHLSGNSLWGKLPTEWPEFLEDLSLSHNKIIGTLHQTKVPRKVDVSRNLISGELSAKVRVNEDPLSFNCSLNRISGIIPSWLQSYLLSDSIAVLDGNVMSCKSALDLSHDPSHSEYVCGSDDLNRALYVWVAVSGLIVLVLCAVACCFRTQSVNKNHLSQQFPTAGESISSMMEEETLDKQIEVPKPSYLAGGVWQGFRQSFVTEWSELGSASQPRAGVGLLSYFMRHVRFFCAAAALFCMTIVMPVVIYLNSAHSTYKYQYAWLISSTFLTGTYAGTILIVLWIMLVVSIIGYQIHTWTASMHQTSTRVAIASGGYIVALTLVLIVIAVDVAAMIFVNYFYIQLYTNTSYNAQEETKLFIQLLLGVAKSTWNVLLGFVINWLSAHESRILGDPRRCVLLVTSLLLYNNIVAPGLVLATTNSQCFLYLFKKPNDITAEYTAPGHTFTVGTTPPFYTLDIVPRKFSTVYTPPFVYSHQCGSSLIRNYVPVYFYSTLMSSFVRPLLLRLLLRRDLRSYPPAVSLFLNNMFPGIVWPRETSRVKQNLLPAIAIVASFSNYLALLLIFGFTCPPLASCVTLGTFFDFATWRLLIERYGRVVKNVDLLDEACRGLEKSFVGVMFLVLCTWACVSTLLIMDMVAADSAWVSSVWVAGIVAVAVAVSALLWLKRRIRPEVRSSGELSFHQETQELQGDDEMKDTVHSLSALVQAVDEKDEEVAAETDVSMRPRTAGEEGAVGFSKEEEMLRTINQRMLDLQRGTSEQIQRVIAGARERQVCDAAEKKTCL